MTEQQFDRLPKWAQNEFEKIQRERDTAIRQLNAYVDDQTESPFRTDDLVSTGERQGPTQKIRYIQSHAMSVVYAGVELTIILRDTNGPPRIDLSWGRVERDNDPVFMVPRSFQSVDLYSPMQRVTEVSDTRRTTGGRG
jgi:hypothetical protein